MKYVASEVGIAQKRATKKIAIFRIKKADNKEFDFTGRVSSKDASQILQKQHDIINDITSSQRRALPFRRFFLLNRVQKLKQLSKYLSFVYYFIAFILKMLVYYCTCRHLDT